MRLTLKKDGTYSLHMKYLDRDSEFDEKGAYKVKGNLLTLTPMDGQPEYYKVEENQVRKLNANHLVIADETRAVGLAGIMGGENSEIVSDTADVVFESANFDGTTIRRTALALGMRTEASAKYEKGLDPLNTLPAVERACELVELLGAGREFDMEAVRNGTLSPVFLSLIHI